MRVKCGRIAVGINTLRFREIDGPGTESMLFRLTILVFLLISSGNLWAQSPPPETKEKSCRQHPLLTGRCFTVRGRLSIYNGAPARRLWKVGTKRVLGISEQRFSVAGYRNIPEDIENRLNQD